MTKLVGTTIGPYHLTEQLGHGGMADVYKAYHRDLEVYRAIKFIRPELVGSEDFRARFQKEAQAVARLRHPNIVQIHDFGASEQLYYMVMEFLEGRTLKAVLREGGRLPMDLALRITRDVAGALEYAHARDLIHRDIKPDNIMLDADSRPVLMDFGIAKLISADTQLTQTGVGMGTPYYMAPEQARGELVSPATDIYGLSIVLFEMLTGQVPFNADTPMAIMLKALSEPLPLPRGINPDISEPLQGLLLKGTAKAPEARYQSAAEFIAALDQIGEARPSAAFRPTGTSERGNFENSAGVTTAQPTQRSGPPNWLPVTALVAVIVAGASGTWWWSQSSGSPSSADTVEQAANVADVVSAAITAYPEPVPETASGSPASTNAEQPDAQTGDAHEEDAQDTPIAWHFDDVIQPGQMVEADVNLSAREVLYLRIFDNSADTTLTLDSPGELARVFEASADTGPLSVVHDGDYQLRFSGGAQSGRFKATLFRLHEPELYAGSVYLGDLFQNATDLPGQVLARDIQLEQDSVIRFDVRRSATTTLFMLIAPDEKTTVFSTRGSTGPVTVPVSGVYGFYADPEGPLLADFEASFELISAPPAQPPAPGT